MTPETRSAVGAGIRESLLIVLGYIPFGLAAGAAMAQTEVSPVLSILSSPILFAGASQLVAIQLIGSGVGIPLIVFTVAIINARHLLYSASLAPHLTEWSRGQRMGAAFREGRFEDGLTQALEEVSALLVAHFPATEGEVRPNELPDEPVLG